MMVFLGSAVCHTTGHTTDSDSIDFAAQAFLTAQAFTSSCFIPAPLERSIDEQKGWQRAS